MSRHPAFDKLIRLLKELFQLEYRLLDGTDPNFPQAGEAFCADSRSIQMNHHGKTGKKRPH